MAKLYVSLIKAGKWELDRVPEKWRGVVEYILNNEE